jgi:hypothetical protein
MYAAIASQQEKHENQDKTGKINSHDPGLKVKKILEFWGAWGQNRGRGFEGD